MAPFDWKRPKRRTLHNACPCVKPFQAFPSVIGDSSSGTNGVLAHSMQDGRMTSWSSLKERTFLWKRMNLTFFQTVIHVKKKLSREEGKSSRSVQNYFRTSFKVIAWPLLLMLEQDCIVGVFINMK